jgi:hypothetical protein
VFLQVQKTTIDELHQKITSKFRYLEAQLPHGRVYLFKLGILRSYKESYKTPIVYSLKEEYAEMLRTELESKNKQIAGI